MTSHQYRYAKKWKLDRQRGLPPRYTDPTPARLHIATLIGAGASRRAVADAAGVSVQAVSQLLKGQKHVRRVTEAKILTVTLDQVRRRDHGDKFVPDLGTRRRIQALMTLGHGHADIADAAGKGRNPSWTANLLHQQGNWVTQVNADAIATAYRALSARPGANGWARTTARRLGYPGPLAWVNIDDPHEEPDTSTGEPTPLPGGQRVHVEDVEWLLDQEAYTWHGLTTRLSCTRVALERALHRAGRRDLVARLTRNTRGYTTPTTTDAAAS